MLADLPLRVFLSHTSDLAEFPVDRSFLQFAKDAVTKAGHVPVDMSDFPAFQGPPASICRERVLASDIFVCVAGFHYGSPVPGNSEISYVEYEFEIAAMKGMSRLAFLIDDKAEIPAWMALDYEYGNRQRAFRQRIQESGLTVRTIANPIELKLELYSALTESLLRSVGDMPLGGAGFEVRLVPFYIVLDVSDAMEGNGIAAVNRILPQIADTVAMHPILRDKVRFSLVAYSDTAQVVLPMCDIADQSRLPELFSGGSRRFTPVFDLLHKQIRLDAQQLKSVGYRLHRSAVFFLSSGIPVDPPHQWRDALGLLTGESELSKLVDSRQPIIIPIGIDEANSEVMKFLVHPSSRSRLYMLGKDGSPAASVVMMAEVLITSVIDSGEPFGGR